MPPRRKVRIYARKEPQQGRSRDLVAAILEAAIRILRSEGASAFTMARIAEKAGVSVGSLYQYFPNKEAVLFRLQTEEWQQTADTVAAILTDTGKTPAQRLRAMVSFFFLSECEEAPFRHALAEAAPLYRATPEALALRKGSKKMTEAFLGELLPDASPARRGFAAEFLKITVSALGARISEEPCSKARLEALANATTDMLLAWLAREKEQPEN